MPRRRGATCGSCKHQPGRGFEQVAQEGSFDLLGSIQPNTREYEISAFQHFPPVTRKAIDHPGGSQRRNEAWRFPRSLAWLPGGNKNRSQELLSKLKHLVPVVFQILRDFRRVRLVVLKDQIANAVVPEQV